MERPLPARDRHLHLREPGILGGGGWDQGAASVGAHDVQPAGCEQETDAEQDTDTKCAQVGHAHARMAQTKDRGRYSSIARTQVPSSNSVVGVSFNVIWETIRA